MIYSYLLSFKLMQQAGVNYIALYPCNTSTYTIDENGTIETITGDPILIENENTPNLTFTTSFLLSKPLYLFNISFFIQNTKASLIDTIQLNAYGYYALINYYNGQNYFISCPIKFAGATSNVNGLNVTMKTETPTKNAYTFKELAQSGELKFVQYSRFYFLSTYDYYIYVRVTSFSLPVNNLVKSDFEIEGKTIISIENIGNGYYKLRCTNINNEFTVSVPSLDLSATYNATNIIYENPLLLLKKFTPPLGNIVCLPYDLTIEVQNNSIISEEQYPNGNWNFKITNSYTKFRPRYDFTIGNNYKITIGIETISTTGGIKLINGETETYFTIENNEISFEAQQNYIVISLVCLSGQLTASLSGIKIEIL